MGDRTSAVEREVKLGAWAGLALPDLSGIAEGVDVLAAPAQRLSATYFDTADLRLARWGVTVRFRSTEVSPVIAKSAMSNPPAPDAPGPVPRDDDAELPWTVKVGTGGAPGGGLARRELGFAGRENRPPPALLQLVRGLTRGAPIAPVARLRTDRLRWHLQRDGERLCEVDDDEVSVLVAGPSGRGRRLAARFRELEVELRPDADPAILETVVGALRAAGAGAPDPTPKVVRALGPRALQPPDVIAETPGRKATVAEVVRAAIAASVERLFRHDPGVRVGDDPEDVHQARVATRRLRSDLRTFGSLLDEGWTRALRDELGWIAASLGDVRDTDVLLERLERHASHLDHDDLKAGDALLSRLRAHREVARTALLVAMDSPRYTDLLDRLVDAAREPRFAPVQSLDPAQGQIQYPQSQDGQGRDGQIQDGLQPEEHPEPGVYEEVAVNVLPALVKKPWGHLQRAVSDLGDRPSDDQLHEVRIRAKRCRYAAEAVAPVVGKPAVGFAQQVAELQGLLGDFHDAIVAADWLRNAASRASTAQAIVAGQLIAVQRQEAQEGRDRWPALWKRASAKKLRTWLSG